MRTAGGVAGSLREDFPLEGGALRSPGHLQCGPCKPVSGGRDRCGEAPVGRGCWGRAALPGLPFPSPKMEKEVSDFIQDSAQIKKKFQPMNKVERSIL